MSDGLAIIHASPALGARFTAYTAELNRTGRLEQPAGQRFAYVLEGEAEFNHRRLLPGSYILAAAHEERAIRAVEAARLFVIEKTYVPCEGFSAPESFSGSEDALTAQSLGGDPDLQVRMLLPDRMDFDFAVNTMIYSPGASLNMVEIHVMEHALLMLEGGGIYRLGDKWYPVQAGDFIWMRAYCPQWFGAIGKKAAKYIIYKDWNRHPLTP